MAHTSILPGGAFDFLTFSHICRRSEEADRIKKQWICPARDRPTHR